MSIIGQLREFDRAKESFEAYIERLENFMEANGVKSENQVAVLLTAIGPETYGLLINLLTPEKPDAKPYKELVGILNSHLHPKLLVIAERFNFHNRFRNDSESVADFAAQLKKFSAHCEFGTFMDDALRDRFVCGLRKESIQRKPLGEKTLDFSKAMEIAQSMEIAEKKSSELKDLGSSGMLKTEEVHRLRGKAHKPKKCSKDKGEKSKSACYRCGNTEHLSSECKSSETVSNCDPMHDSLGFFRIREQDAQAATVTMTVEGKELVWKWTHEHL
ncbi:uncharacterized protein [Montipora foliosa]|uniref:uncharacterized protein n=1 Tax=Montipora foliosa TaxID=591990 RepID=UPI0035F193F7